MPVAMPSPTQFWMFAGDSAKGPFTIPQMQAKLASGEATWGTKICPVGETEWRPLHRAPGLIADAQRPVGSQPVRTIAIPIPSASRPISASQTPALQHSPLKPRNARTAKRIRYAVLGVGLLAILGIGYAVIRSSLTDAFDGYERGYGDTVLRYLDRPYDGAKWTQLKETTSFSEMVALGNSSVTELYGVAGWDDNNLWVVNLTGQVFQLRDGHWQFAAKLENAHYPRMRVLDQDTVLVGGTHLYRLSPGNIADIGEVSGSTDKELFPADRGLIYCYCTNTDAVRFADNIRTVLKVDLFKEATVHRKDNTPLNGHLVKSIRHSRPVKPGLAFAVSPVPYGKKKLVRFENGFWLESSDLPDKDAKDLWLSGSAEAPHVVLAGSSGWVYVQPSGSTGAERTLATSPDPTKANLIKVWGTSPDKFWVMDEHGTVWELNRSESRIVVRGLRRDDVTFRDAWVSPTGSVYAITTKHLYRLN